MKKMNCFQAAKEAGLNKSSLSKISGIAKKASILGGNVLMDYYGNLKNINNKGRIGDLVTDADIEAERVVINFLKKEIPEISILAEESGQIGKEKDLCWCLDPLDGTTNFAHGYPFFATSIYPFVWRPKIYPFCLFSEFPHPRKKWTKVPFFCTL